MRANYTALSPLSFLVRCRDVFGDREALIYGDRRYTWRQLHDRSASLAAALRVAGIGKNDVVSVMAANTPEMVEAIARSQQTVSGMQAEVFHFERDPGTPEWLTVLRVEPANDPPK